MQRTTSESVAANVRMQIALRRMQGVDLGKRLGLKKQAIAARLRGDVPFTVAEVARMAEIFNISVDELCDPEPFGRVAGNAGLAGRAAGKSGPHSVSPAPSPGDAGSRTSQLDRPATREDGVA